MALVATVTIPAVNVSADLTDFIVTIDLSDLGASFWATVADGGGDIRCYKADGTTELARDIEACATATDTGVLHVKYSGTLSSSSDTYIQIHADGSSADYAVTDTYGRNAVWSDYAFVLHLNDLTPVDSAGNYSPTVSGLSATRSGPFYGECIDFGSGYVQLAASGPLLSYAGSNSFTLQAQIEPDTNPTGNWMIAGNDDNPGGTAVWADNDGAVTGESNLISATRFVGQEASRPETNGNTILGGNSYLVHFTGDATDSEVFLAGVLSATRTQSISQDTSTGAWRIGDGPGFTVPFNGGIKEVRGRNSKPGPDWYVTEHTNQFSPGTFYSVTDEGGGSGSTIEASAGFTTNHSVSASRAAVFNAFAGFSTSHSVSNGGQADLTAEAVLAQAHTLSASGQQDLQASIALANTLGLQSSYGAIVEAAASLTTNHSLTAAAISTLVAHSALSISSNLAASSNATLGAEALLSSNHTVQSTTGSTIDAAASLLLTSSASADSDISLEGLADFSMSCSVAAEVIAQLNASISISTVQSLIAQTNAVLLAQAQFQTDQTVQVVGGQTIEAVGELSLVSSVDASGNITTTIEFTPLDDGRKVTVLAQSRTVTVLAQNRIVTVH